MNRLIAEEAAYILGIAEEGLFSKIKDKFKKKPKYLDSDEYKNSELKVKVDRCINDISKALELLGNKPRMKEFIEDCTHKNITPRVYGDEIILEIINCDNVGGEFSDDAESDMEDTIDVLDKIAKKYGFSTDNDGVRYSFYIKITK